jgi:pimeloyl-ACP methyl ester carboxylesterase
VSQFPPETHYVEVGGGLVGYQVMGGGPIDVIQAQGLGSHIDLNWDLPNMARFHKSLASISRYIVFDRRGTGVSDPIGRDTAATWEDWAEDIGAVLDSVGSPRAAVMAVQDAGPMAMLFAAMRPERVSKLVLVNTAALLASR